MSQLMQRLSDYWWPRMSSEPCLESCPHKYVTYYEKYNHNYSNGIAMKDFMLRQLSYYRYQPNNTLDHDSSQPFKDGLRFDKYAGQPFLDYLTK